MAHPILDDEKIIKLTEKDGLLCRFITGFEPRKEQAAMMKGVIDAYNKSQIALIEAGTGTGKSLSYLIPALIFAAKTGERTVISTNTIALQEQLLQKDIPILLKALNLNLKAVLVKGMSNYICLRKLEDAHLEQSFFPTEENKEIEKIEALRSTNSEGSRSGLSFLPTPSVWERVGAESSACSRNECPYFQQCYFYKARREAQEAHILIVNHHLLFTDLLKKGETDKFNEDGILPSYKRVILDEAHNIEDIATEYFANRLNRFDLLRTLSKLTSEKSAMGYGKLTLLKEKIVSLFKRVPPDFLALSLQLLNIDLPALRHSLNDKIHEIFEACEKFINENQKNHSSNETEDVQREQKLRLLQNHLASTHWQDEIVTKAKNLIEILHNYSCALNSLEGSLKCINNDKLQEVTKSTRIDIQSLNNMFLNYADQLKQFFLEDFTTSKVKWMENQLYKSSVNVHLIKAELDISSTLANLLFSRFPTIVLCSATLASNKKFDYTKSRLGIHPQLIPYKPVTEYIFDSPFNFATQAALAIATDIPPPTDPNFLKAASAMIWKSITISHGGVFVLFTSYAMLKKCAENLSENIKSHGYELLQQGSCTRQALIQRFKTTPRAILFGTDSFWEGVDVAGDALRCVIIVKLPFKVPSEPIIQAKTEAILARGGEPFSELSLPYAIMKFKQGFGRLIRNKWDRGCIVCLDNRIITKSYGQLFLNSLPPCKKIFAPQEELFKQMKEFYKNTSYLAKQNPISYSS